jgi:tetratricopeptide (TPR) repeat protein
LHPCYSLGRLPAHPPAILTDLRHRTADSALVDAAPTSDESGEVNARIAAAELRLGRIQEALQRYDALGRSPDRASALAVAMDAPFSAALTLLTRIAAEPGDFIALGDRELRRGSTYTAVEAYAHADATDRIADIAYSELAQNRVAGLHLLGEHSCRVDMDAILAFLDRTIAHALPRDIVGAYDLAGVPLPLRRLEAVIDDRLTRGVASASDLRLLQERGGVLPAREKVLAWVPRVAFRQQVEALALLGATEELERLGHARARRDDYASAITCFARAGAVEALHDLAAELWRRRKREPHLVHTIIDALAAARDPAQLEGYATELMGHGDLEAARALFGAAIRLTADMGANNDDTELIADAV